PLFEFDRARMFRSGLVGFTLHGSLSHYYYQFCEVIILLVPFQFLLCALDGFSDLFLLFISSNFFFFPGAFSISRLVGGSCKSGLRPNCLGGSLEQHLLCHCWIPSSGITS